MNKAATLGTPPSTDLQIWKVFQFFAFYYNLSLSMDVMYFTLRYFHLGQLCCPTFLIIFCFIFNNLDLQRHKRTNYAFCPSLARSFTQNKVAFTVVLD